MKNQQLSVIYYFTDMRLNHWNITYYDGANPLVAGEWAGDIPVPTNLSGHGTSVGAKADMHSIGQRLLPLGLGALVFSHLFIVVCRVKLGAVRAPRGHLYCAIDFSQPFSGDAQGHDLANTHHNVPTHNLDACGRKGFIKPLVFQLRVNLL